MQFWGFCMVHHKYRIRAPHRALWCWLSYALFGALFLHFYLDETSVLNITPNIIQTLLLTKVIKIEKGKILLFFIRCFP